MARQKCQEGGASLALLPSSLLLHRIDQRRKSPIRTSSRSPEAIGPTPLGVPVRMMSPGSRVRLVEMKLTS